MASEPRRKRKPRYERRIFALALLTGLPAVVLALVLLWTGDFAPRTQWTVTILMVGVKVTGTEGKRRSLYGTIYRTIFDHFEDARVGSLGGTADGSGDVAHVSHSLTARCRSDGVRSTLSRS